MDATQYLYDTEFNYYNIMNDYICDTIIDWLINCMVE